ncbi:hypothetical protein AE921_08340 [Xanthomonas arboricola]|nr:hypothetical protein AKJ12_16105 [Xanthomonas arboricola pv. juglandis]KOB00058.1 hypothetical protein AE920_10430 [Xanthomonas arboricola]KOB01440.1 hypothetical protein AE921_08340 [Xanthomonas arboricola]KOB10846.1 hypothetical protein AE922_02775 [Xanthomonas arboricola]KOB11471.1 hypothetical protein AE923_03600 [Xanthomonas arboricola]
MTLLVSREIAMKSSDLCVRLLWGHALRRVAYEVAIDQAHLECVGQAIDSSRDALCCGLIAAQRCLSVGGELQSFKPICKFL